MQRFDSSAIPLEAFLTAARKPSSRPWRRAPETSRSASMITTNRFLRGRLLHSADLLRRNVNIMSDRSILAFVAIVTLTLFSGCGAKKGTLQGKVTYKDKAL